MIRIGNQTSCWAASVTEPFDYALAHGFEAFEWFPDKKPEMGWDGSDLDAARRRAIRQTAVEHGLRMSVHARWQANPLQPGSSTALARDLELTRDLGAVLLNLHLYHEAGLRAYIEAILPWVWRTAEAGLRLAIENTPYHPPELFNELFDRLHDQHSIPLDHVGMCLDTGHANLCAATRNDYLGFFDRLDPQVPICHLHLHENWGDSDSHLPLFTGPAAKDDTGVRGLLQRLQRRHYSGSAILEQWPHPPTLLDQARDHLLTLIPRDRSPSKPDHPAPQTAALPPRRRSDPCETAPEERSVARRPRPPEEPGSLAEALVAADKQARSWREKLEAVRALLARSDTPLTVEHLVEVAIYLRFLGTGEIQCAEDGRHFRPSHHARIATEIQQRLAKLETPEQISIARGIYPWLPSSGQTFRRAEPLTRIRDIAHRNDLPPELKREIKQSLQNKLHRCAGPEDLVTSARLLDRITASGADYSTAFIEQFRIFHQELEEFFHARSLDDQLTALLAKAESNLAAQICAFRESKDAPKVPGQGLALARLTELRTTLLAAARRDPTTETQDLLLADIGLEHFAFMLLSKLINGFEATTARVGWEPLLETLRLTLVNLGLSSVVPEECQALAGELQAWQQTFQASDRDKLLRLRASVARARRLAEDYSDRILALMPPRVEQLGRALGVADHAIRVFCEAEVRSHLIFQLAKLVATLSRRLRKELVLPAWDVLVTGKAVGRLRVTASLDTLGQNLPEPVIALLHHADGDEEIPAGLAAIVLAHEIPHLSHLAVRARQAGVIFVTSEASAELQEFEKHTGQVISLLATPEKVQWESAGQTTAAQPVSPPAPLPRPAKTKAARVCPAPEHPCLSLEQATLQNAGGKAHGARRLVELARQPKAGFKTSPAVVVPFGVMEAALRIAPETENQFHALRRQLDTLPPEAIAPHLDKMRRLIRNLSIPEGLTEAVAPHFRPDDRLMARSSSNCEDLEAMAGAGLYETVPNVTAAGVGEAVKQVWASLWTGRAVLNRRQAGIPNEQAAMAVLIQQMVTADYSFVLHTVNPTNGDRGEVYAELAVGLGETLVSAAARGTPYRLVVQKTSGAITTLAFANFRHALRPNPAGGLRSETVDYSRVELSRDAGARERLGRRLGAIAAFVEEALGQPQDIEGAVLAGEIYLLQSRPQQGLTKKGREP